MLPGELLPAQSTVYFTVACMGMWFEPIACRYFASRNKYIDCVTCLFVMDGQLTLESKKSSCCFGDLLIQEK